MTRLGKTIKYHIDGGSWHGIGLRLLNVLYNTWGHLDTSERETDLHIFKGLEGKTGKQRKLKINLVFQLRELLFLLEKNSYPILQKQIFEDNMQRCFNSQISSLFQMCPS